MEQVHTIAAPELIEPAYRQLLVVHLRPIGALEVDDEGPKDAP